MVNDAQIYVLDTTSTYQASMIGLRVTIFYVFDVFADFSGFIKNIFTCVLKMNRSFMGLEQLEGE